jgi:hypothetical protein
MEQIAWTSSTWQAAEVLVSPIIRHLPPDTAFEFVQSLEAALSAAANPPAWISATDVNRYCKWRWKMAFRGANRPNFRLVGGARFYRREEVDTWATARIEAAPEVPHM